MLRMKSSVLTTAHRPCMLWRLPASSLPCLLLSASIHPLSPISPSIHPLSFGVPAVPCLPSPQDIGPCSSLCQKHSSPKSSRTSLFPFISVLVQMSSLQRGIPKWPPFILFTCLPHIIFLGSADHHVDFYCYLLHVFPFWHETHMRLSHAYLLCPTAQGSDAHSRCSGNIC